MKRMLTMMLVIGMLTTMTACDKQEAVGDGLTGSTTTAATTTEESVPTTTESTTTTMTTTITTTTTATTTTAAATTTTTRRKSTSTWIACPGPTTTSTTRLTLLPVTTSTTQSTTPSTTSIPNTTTTAPVLPENPFTFGVVENNTYENTYIGIGCHLTEDWVFATKEEILEANGLSPDLTEEELAQQIANTTVLYDMYATNEAGESININAEKADPQVLAELDLTLLYADLLPIIDEMLVEAGAESTVGEVITVTVDGKEYTAIDLDVAINGLTVHEVLFGIVCDNHLVTVTVAGLNESIQSLLNTFYHLQ